LTERTSGSDATGNFLTRPHEFYFYDLASPIIDTEGAYRSVRPYVTGRETYERQPS